MNTDDLIARLGREATPVAPLPAPGIRTAWWAVGGALYLFAVGAMKFLAMSPGGVVLAPLYVLEQTAALATGVAAARAALTSVVPGAGDRPWRLPAVAAAAWLGLVFVEAAGNVQTAGTLGLTRETDWPCVASMMFGGALLGGPLVWMLRRGAPLTPRVTAWLAGVAAVSVANVEACLTRPHAFAATVLVWHGATAILVAALFAAAGRRWLPWPARGER